MNEARANPFDAARERLQGAKRKRRVTRPDAPDTIVPLDPLPADEPLDVSRLDAARARLRRAIPPRGEDD